MRFAVTGGAGFIGQHIVRQLIGEGHSVVIADNTHAGNLEPAADGIEFKRADICHLDGLEDALKDVDGIFHEAALTSVTESFRIPYEYRIVNVQGAQNVFSMAKNLGLKVVHASSSAVYGNLAEIPIREDAPNRPINPYAQTKADAEKIARVYMDDGVRIVGLRYFNVYGRGQTGSYAGVITRFMQRLEEGRPPIINGAGSQTRDFIHVEDVASASVAAMKSDIGEGFFNIGTGVATSIRRLAEVMIQAYELPLEIEFADPLPGDVEKSQADTDLTAKRLSWRYTIKLEDGLRKTIRSDV